MSRMCLSPSRRCRSFPLKEWRWSKVRDARTPNLKEVAAQFDDSAWPAVDVSRGEGPLTENESAVFRTRLLATEGDADQCER